MSHAGPPPADPWSRASDAERDQAAEILRAGYAEGRLSRAELDERFAAACAAKTRSDLRDLTSDLPGATSAAAGRDRPATLPFADPESETGVGPDRCLLLCLLFAFPPAGIIYWILTARRQPQLAAGGRSPMPGYRNGMMTLNGDDPVAISVSGALVGRAVAAPWAGDEVGLIAISNSAGGGYRLPPHRTDEDPGLRVR